MSIPLDELIKQNEARYKRLVAAFKPEPGRRSAAAKSAPNPDMTVCARIRPLKEDEEAAGALKSVFLRDDAEETIDIHELRQPVRGLPVLKSAAYRVDHVFDEKALTKDMYEKLVQPLVPWAWGGGSATLFAYGQTGSGKTFTVSGLEELVADTLTNGGLEGRRNIFLSVVELAGNSARDLLNDQSQIQILEDAFGATQLVGVIEERITSAESMLASIDKASSFRRTESTEKNDTSSRSHAICRIRIEIPSLPDAEDGLLYLVDLAGSEAARDVANHGADRMRETKEINTSLSVLKDCIRGKAEADVAMMTGAKRPHVPLIGSALTKVLKHVLDPESTRPCKTVVVGCINPNLLDAPASRNTLRYAEMLRVLLPIAGEKRYEADVPMSWNNVQLREWIERESGSLPISAALLAPKENGQQLLRLPAAEFDLRCMALEGVTPEQALAFRTKFWQVHVDSQAQRKRATVKGNFSAARTEASKRAKNPPRISSRDLHKDDAGTVPFKERICPGMVVRWISEQGNKEGSDLAVILCPTSDAASIGTAQDREGGFGFLCAAVKPGSLPGSYEVLLWSQYTVLQSSITEEVVLEYDPASRFYFMAV